MLSLTLANALANSCGSLLELHEARASCVAFLLLLLSLQHMLTCTFMINRNDEKLEYHMIK
jgi:hypothetical protein